MAFKGLKDAGQLLLLSLAVAFGARLAAAVDPDKDQGPDDVRARQAEARKQILPVGAAHVPIQRLVTAYQRMRAMRRYQLGQQRLLPADPALQSAPPQGNSYLVPQDAPTLSAPSSGPAALVPMGTACNWTPLGPGNIGGRTRCILVSPSDPNVMYAGAATGGVFKTVDGANWFDTGLMMDLGIGCMAMDPSDPNTLYVGTGEDVRGVGIFKTTDAGATWTLLPGTANANFQMVRHLAISPHDHLRVYAATDNGIFVSNDGGNTWNLLFNPGLGYCADIRIRSDTPNDYILASFGDWNGYLYVNPAADAGGTWTQTLSNDGTSPSVMGLTSIAIAPSAQNVMYAMSADSGHGWNLHGFYKSTDGGMTWTLLVDNRSNVNDSINKWLISYSNDRCANPATTGNGQGFYDNVIAVDPSDANRIFAGGIDEYRSDDGGLTWGLAGAWTRDLHADQHCIYFPPQYNGVDNTTMYFGNDGGVYRSDDPLAATTTDNCAANTAINFLYLNHGWLATEFYDGASYPGGQTYIGGAQDNGTSRGTDAGGINGWQSIGGGDGHYVAVDPGNTNVLFEYYPIQKSTDGGSTWASAMSGITDNGGNNVFVMDPGNAQNLWTGGNMIWRTTNQAAGWSQASTPMHGNLASVAVNPTNSQNVLVGDDQGYIYTNSAALSAGASTAWPATQPAGGYVSWIAFDPNTPTTAYATYSTYGAVHVWKTTNGGASWFNSQGSGSTGIPDLPCRTVLVDPQDSSRVFVGTDLGLFVSLDAGATWAPVTDFPAVATYSLNVDAATYTLFAFTRGRGAYRICLNSGAPTPTPTATPTPLVGSGVGLCKEYFNNTALSGAPCGSQLDPYPYFVLGPALPPVPGCTTLSTNFSIRWTGYVQPEFTEAYTFYTHSDDGCRLMITDPSTGLVTTVVNDWVTQGPTTTAGAAPFPFVAGQKYYIEFDYFQGGGGAEANLSWGSPNTPVEVIPTSQLYPSGACSVPSLTATPTYSAPPTLTASMTPTITPTPVQQPVWRVRSGGGAVTDCQGDVWAADQGYSGGAANSSSNSISGALPCPADQALYQDERWSGSPGFSYSFGVPPGDYQVTLKFAELFDGTAGQRVFNVSINGVQVLTNFDIFALSGGLDKALDEVFDNITPLGGVITIQFSPAPGSPDQNVKVDALQIIPEPSTPTASPSPSVTVTPTPSASASESPSSTASTTPSASPSAEPTPSATPTLLDSPSPSPTPSPSATFTATATPSASGTSSATASITAKATITATASITAKATITATPGITATGTPTAAQPSPTATGSTTRPPGPTPGPSTTATPAPGSPTATPAGAGVLAITRFDICPDPARGRALTLAFDLAGPAEAADVKLYTVAMNCVMARKLEGPLREGWNRALLTLDSPLASGLYYVVLTATRQGGVRSRPSLGRVYYLP